MAVRFLDLKVIGGPAIGMRFSVEFGSYRVLGRTEHSGESTQLLDRSGERHLQPDQLAVIHALGNPAAESRPNTRGADIYLADKSVSQTHCIVFLHHGGARVADLMSTNGTLLNGISVENASLEDGDTLKIGNSELQILLEN